MLNRKIVFPIISIILLVVALTITNTEEVLHNFSRFPVWLIFLVLGLLGINLGVVTYRLKQVLIHFGIAAPAWVVLKANISGYVASLFFISLFGQVAGRHLVLSKFGVPPSILAFLTAYERIVLFIISGSLCLLGAVFILDSLTISKFLTNISIVEIVITASGGLILSLWLSRSKFESFLVKRTKSLKNIINVSEVIAITLIAQLLIFTTFIIGVLVLQPNVDFWELLAAVAITSFAASLPLSVNGWGVRELAAVYALGKIGVSSPNALAVSILVGLCSTAIILIAAPIALKKQVNGCLKKPLIIITESIDAIQIEKAAVWLIVTATAVLLFFQIHLTLAGGIINVNLADPFAILALSVTVLHIISTRQFPNWRIFQFNKILISISALFIFSFFNGVVEIGITQWALVGRLFGWLVLLGYLSVGYLTVHYLGGHGLRRLSETIVSTAVAVIVVQISLRFLDKSGWLTGLYISPNFQGFAGNRNAFAFQ
ncbi:MAG TPA: flippase-like domain-containing protein, partial [Thioploca sp.]|nr:flippase-like domain-containing protein [Thioploca sp.]